MLKIYQKKYATQKGFDAVVKLTAKLKGKRGVPALRERLNAYLQKKQDMFVLESFSKWAWQGNERKRLFAWKESNALALAKKCTFEGVLSGKRAIDFIPKFQSHKAPYFDMGNEGLALVEVYRTTTYARSCKWSPSTAHTRYLIGKNEAGTYFSHPVSYACTTVLESIKWMWGGRQNNIIIRQGDIALIAGKGLKLPKLPSGHVVEGSWITHDTHSPLPMPKTNERIIVARRAFERVSSASRD